MIINCKTCGRERVIAPSLLNRGRGKYCSLKCRPGGMTGKKHSDNTKKLMSEKAKIRAIKMPHTIPDTTDVFPRPESKLKMSQSHGGRLKDGVGNYRKGYVALHKYVRRRYPIANECQFCQKQCKTHLANKTGDYLRELSDWLELCPSCHAKYDRDNNLHLKYQEDVW